VINDEIDKLTSRHIAKCLDNIDEELTTRQQHYIKKAFRFLSEDIKQQVINKGIINEEKFHPTQRQSVNY
jgi:hypothetical protein